MLQFFDISILISPNVNLPSDRLMSSTFSNIKIIHGIKNNNKKFYNDVSNILYPFS